MSQIAHFPNVMNQKLVTRHLYLTISTFNLIHELPFAMPTFLNNSPLEELTPENDAFQLLEKSNFIAAFLQEYYGLTRELQIISLYGSWGSGKTTMMKAIAKQLDSSTAIHTVFFEAWKLERDNAIELSLLSTIAEELPDPSQVGELLKHGYFMLKSVASGLSLSVGNGRGAKLSITPRHMFDAYDKELKKEEEEKQGSLSFKQRQETFIESFEKTIKALIKKKGLGEHGRIIVFIDDLDRCEPENVLDLLAAIKLFFTYSKHITFVCGIDKEAVAKAIKTRYRDAVKAEEYLEKVFDHSFHMPQNLDLEVLLKQVFGGIKPEDCEEEEAINKLVGFFEQTNFTNPRHIKKVLNKYGTLRALKESGSSELSQHIPDVYSASGGYWLDTMCSLAIIVLHEYYPAQLKDISNYEAKVNSWTKCVFASNDKVADLKGARDLVVAFAAEGTTEESLLRLCTYIPNAPSKAHKDLIGARLASLFLPSLQNTQFSTRTTDAGFYAQFEQPNNTFLINFCRLLVAFAEEAPQKDSEEYDAFFHNELTAQDYFRMAQVVL